MVPELTTCDGCGREVLILSWSPIDDGATDQDALGNSLPRLVSCQLDCPHCGSRIQLVCIRDGQWPSVLGI
jgi:hypothetical protein